MKGYGGPNRLRKACIQRICVGNVKQRDPEEVEIRTQEEETSQSAPAVLQDEFQMEDTPQ